LKVVLLYGIQRFIKEISENHKLSSYKGFRNRAGKKCETIDFLKKRFNRNEEKRKKK